jgi:O-succinylbenzoic acid--CoA ligase
VESLSLFDAARDRSEGIAVAGAGFALTFGDLAQRVRATMTELARRVPLEPGAPVGLVARPSLPSLEVLLALAELQAPVVLIHPRTPALERERLLARASAAHCFLPDEAALAPISVAPAPSPAGIAAPRLQGAERSRFDRTFAIVPTSGSTGAPKLVVLDRSAVWASARASVQQIALESRDRWLLCLPIAHVGGFAIVARSIVARSTVVLFDAGERGLLRDVPRLASILEDQRVTVVSLVPTLLDALLAHLPDWHPPEALRAVLIGGAALSSQLLERATARGVRPITTYGLTEACSQVTAAPLGAAPRVRDGIVSAGRPLAGVELGFDAGGRIRIRGPNLCSGFVDSPAPIDEAGWFQTDDRGSLDDEGYLYVSGRASELIVTGGENVDPRKVEAILERQPGVRQAYVFGVPDERFGELVAAAVVCDDPAAFDRAALDSALRTSLARHELPRKLAIVPDFILLPNGKLDAVATRSLARAAFDSDRRP